MYRILQTITIVVITLTGASAFAENAVESVMHGQVDSQAVQWRAATDSSNPTAVFATLTPGIHRFELTAYRDGKRRREGSIQLEFLLRDGSVEDLEVRHYPFAPRHPRFSLGPDHGEGELSIESIDISASATRLAGRFQGELFYHQSPNTRPIPHRKQHLVLEIDQRFVRD